MRFERTPAEIHVWFLSYACFHRADHHTLSALWTLRVVMAQTFPLGFVVARLLKVLWSFLEGCGSKSQTSQRATVGPRHLIHSVIGFWHVNGTKSTLKYVYIGIFMMCLEILVLISCLGLLLPPKKKKVRASFLTHFSFCSDVQFYISMRNPA